MTKDLVRYALFVVQLVIY